MKSALIRVDIQNDFTPGGALAVPDGDQIIPVVNKLSALPQYDLIIDTQDWHPSDHCSFAANHVGKQVFDMVSVNGIEQVLWPIHCVQDTTGAEFHHHLNRQRVDRTVQKGTDKNIDSYSGFYDNGHLRSTGLSQYLQEHSVGNVDVVGLALDYCVMFTALDAQQQGFNTRVIEDACRAIAKKPEEYQQILFRLRQAGVQVIKSNDLLN